MNPADRLVTWRHLLAIGATTLLVGGGIVALCDWLVPPGTATPPIDAAVEDDPVQPGMVVCPRSLGSPEPVPVVSSDLYDCPDLYDGVQVRYTGEVIQAVLRRGDRAWVQLNDDAYALDAGPIATHRTALGGNAGVPVSIPIAVAEDIRRVGDGTGTGDLVAVVGTFLRADPDDGGGPTVQASSARIAARGQRTDVPVTPRRVAVAAALLALVIPSGLAVRLRRRS